MTSHDFRVKSINIPQFHELNVHILQKTAKAVIITHHPNKNQ